MRFRFTSCSFTFIGDEVSIHDNKAGLVDALSIDELAELAAFAIEFRQNRKEENAS